MARKKNDKKEETALATKEGSVMILADQDFALAKFDTDKIIAAVSENFDGEDLGPNDLDRVRIPSGGALQWLVPDLEEDEIALKTLRGIIVAKRASRAYWESSLDESGGGTPPDCSSQDGKIGQGNPGGDCSDCPFNQFGSANAGEGRGKACKEMRLVFLMRPGNNLLPLIVVLSPTSITPLKKYMQRLSNAGMTYKQLVTDIGLESDQNKDGIKFAKATFGVAKDGDKKLFLDPESTAHVQAYAASLAKAFETVRVDVTREDVTE